MKEFQIVAHNVKRGKKGKYEHNQAGLFIPPTPTVSGQSMPEHVSLSLSRSLSFRTCTYMYDAYIRMVTMLTTNQPSNPQEIAFFSNVRFDILARCGRED